MNSHTLTSLIAIGFAGVLGALVMPSLTGCVKQEGQVKETEPNEAGAIASVPDRVSQAPTPSTSDRKVPVVLEPSTIDLGIVSPGTIGSGHVLLRNVGDVPLKILTSKTSCQCTIVDLAETVIGPNESIEIPAQFDPGTQFGIRTADIFLIFEGYDDPVEIPIRAEVAYVVRSVPSIITRRIPNTERYTDKPQFVIEAIDGRSFQILRVHDEAPQFVDFDPESDESRSTYTLIFDFNRFDTQLCIDEEGRPMPSYLVIETDHPGCPILDVRLRHECTAHERPSPGQAWTLAYRRALLGVMEPGASREFDVPLRWAPNAQVMSPILKVVSESPQFFSELVDVYEKDDTYWYRVRITPTGHHRGFLYGTVRFQSAQFDMAMTIIGRVDEVKPGDG
ncbi:MAG: DUF1573 domain-containing protein [Planctomycetota bacterium]|nr:DUF1573 domain-containing protein [Planctomycetota bacterium]